MAGQDVTDAYPSGQGPLSRYRKGSRKHVRPDFMRASIKSWEVSGVWQRRSVKAWAFDRSPQTGRQCISEALKGQGKERGDAAQGNRSAYMQVGAEGCKVTFAWSLVAGGEVFAQSPSTFSQDFRLWSAVFMTAKRPSSFLAYMEVQSRFPDLDER